MLWQYSNRADHITRKIADRHYNRQKIGSNQFVPPGRCLVLYAKCNDKEAFWITSWPYKEYVKHAWGGAWICSAFRNEGVGLSSKLILDAVAATVHHFGHPPKLGMITFIDKKKVKNKRDFGRCYRKAGFKEIGYTKGGLLVLQLKPEDMPPAATPTLNQLSLL